MALSERIDKDLDARLHNMGLLARQDNAEDFYAVAMQIWRLGEESRERGIWWR